MWFWIKMIALCYVLLLVMEELIYYFWNRFVFGPNKVKQLRWKNRLTVFITLFKRKRHPEMPEKSTEKSSF